MFSSWCRILGALYIRRVNHRSLEYSDIANFEFWTPILQKNRLDIIRANQPVLGIIWIVGHPYLRLVNRLLRFRFIRRLVPFCLLASGGGSSSLALLRDKLDSAVLPINCSI